MTLREVLPLRRSTDLPIKHNADRFFALPPWRHNLRSSLEGTAVDIVENNQDFCITVEIPGMKAKDVEVSIEKGRITLKGERKQESKEDYSRQERSHGAFKRPTVLPERAYLDKAEASAGNGLLTITVPKKASSQSKERKLEVIQAA